MLLLFCSAGVLARNGIVQDIYYLTRPVNSLGLFRAARAGEDARAPFVREVRN
jgi:hypothetical protein